MIRVCAPEVSRSTADCASIGSVVMASQSIGSLLLVQIVAVLAVHAALLLIFFGHAPTDVRTAAADGALCAHGRSPGVDAIRGGWQGSDDPGDDVDRYQSQGRHHDHVARSQFHGYSLPDLAARRRRRAVGVA